MGCLCIWSFAVVVLFFLLKLLLPELSNFHFRDRLLSWLNFLYCFSYCECVCFLDCFYQFCWWYIKKPTKFCLSILNLTTLWNLLISTIIFLVDCSCFSVNKFMSLANKDNFTSSVTVWMPSTSESCLIVLAKASNKVKMDIHVFFQTLKRKL